MTITTKQEWDDLLELAKQGNSEAMNEVAMYLRDGLIIDNKKIIGIDKNESFNWTKKSFESGDLEGMIEYANYLSYPENGVCEKNIDKAMELYEIAMNKGSQIATRNLGIEYRNKQNYEKAFEYYLKAGRDEELYEDLTIGLCYYNGVGVKKDKLKAFEIFKNIDKSKCSAYETNEINYLLGRIYLEGEIVEQNISKAREYLELANEDEDHRSALELLLIIGRKKLIN